MYHGATIDIRAVLREIETAAQLHGWRAERFHEAGGFPFIALHRAPPAGGDSPAASRIYISAGIHGDEPAGPLAALKLISGKPLAGECGDVSATVFEPRRLHFEPA